MKDQQVIIRRLPEGLPRPDDFELVDSPPREDIASGQIRVQTQWLSLDPYVRALLSGRHFLRMPQPGDVMPAKAVARVIESRNDVFNVGDRIWLETGLRSTAVSDGADAWRLHPGHVPGLDRARHPRRARHDLVLRAARRRAAAAKARRCWSRRPRARWAGWSGRSRASRALARSASPARKEVRLGAA